MNFLFRPSKTAPFATPHHIWSSLNGFRDMKEFLLLSRPDYPLTLTNTTQEVEVKVTSRKDTVLHKQLGHQTFLKSNAFIDRRT